VFNIAITLNADLGATVAESIVYKATSDDANPIISFGGENYTVTRALAAPSILPGSGTFTDQPLNSTLDFAAVQTGYAGSYTLASSNSSHISVSTLTRTTFRVKLVSTTWSGSETITVADTFGQSVTVVISFAPLTVTPSSVIFAAPLPGPPVVLPSPSTLTISGGVGPYSAVPSSPVVISATVAGTTLTITELVHTVGSYTVTVTDALGVSVAVPVTVN
jgi:hypothetical protein